MSRQNNRGHTRKSGYTRRKQKVLTPQEEATKNLRTGNAALFYLIQQVLGELCHQNGTTSVNTDKIEQGLGFFLARFGRIPVVAGTTLVNLRNDFYKDGGKLRGQIKEEGMKYLQTERSEVYQGCKSRYKKLFHGIPYVEHDLWWLIVIICAAVFRQRANDNVSRQVKSLLYK